MVIKSTFARIGTVTLAAALSVSLLAGCSNSTPGGNNGNGTNMSATPTVSVEKQGADTVSKFFTTMWSDATSSKYASTFTTTELVNFYAKARNTDTAATFDDPEVKAVLAKVKSEFPELSGMLASKASDKDVPQDAYLLVFMLTMATPGSPYVGTELKLPESFALATILIGVSGPAANVASRGVTFVIPESAIKVAADGKSATVAPGSATLVKLNDESTTSSEASFFDKLVLLRAGESWKLDLSTMITNTVPK